MFRFKERFRELLRRPTLAEHLEKLAAAGLLVEQRFRARRACEVREFEDEGRHIFLELEDGSVLFMSGQYLHDYGIDSAGPAEADSRTFPATEFVVARHKEENYVCEIRASGMALQPEAEFPAYTREDCDAERVPEDGHVITSVSFEDLVAAQGRINVAHTNPSDRA